MPPRAPCRGVATIPSHRRRRSILKFDIIYIHANQDRGAASSPRRSRKRKTWWLDGSEFRDLRLGCLLNQRACAEFLGVAVRTVRAWDSGRTRVPWAAVRLMRLFRSGELESISKPWAGWLLRGERLISPEGREFRPHQMSYWANTVAMAELWRSERRTARLSAGSDLRADKEVVDVGQGRMPAAVPVRIRLDLPAVLHLSVPSSADPFFSAGQVAQGDGREVSAPGLVSLCNKSDVVIGIRMGLGLQMIAVEPIRCYCGAEVVPHSGGSDGRYGEAQSEVAGRDTSLGDGAGGTAACESQQLVHPGDRGTRQLSLRSAGQTGAPVGSVTLWRAGGVYALAPASAFSAGAQSVLVATGAQEARAERAVFLRQRQEVQAVSWSARCVREVVR